MEAKKIHTKYEHLGTEGFLLGAIEYAKSKLSNCSHEIYSKKSSGDIITELDKTVHNSFIEYFRINQIPVCILGEEGQSSDIKPKYAILIDEIEGTQNAVNDLDYGINVAIAKYSHQLKVKDLESAVVVNLRNDTIYVGVKDKGAYKIQNGEKMNLIQKETDIYECPNPWAYTLDQVDEDRQITLSKIFRNALGPQPRSIDATGTRLVELVNGNIRAYGDWRNATKCWDVLPSALILTEENYTFTDILGFDLSESIFYDKNNSLFTKDGGLNRRVGENFITSNKEDHNLLTFGNKNRDVNLRWLEVECTWDSIILDSNEIPKGGLMGGYGGMIWQNWFLKEGGKSFAEVINKIIDEKQEAYGSLNSSNVKDIIKKIGDTYLKKISNISHLGNQLSTFNGDITSLI
jgi:fructose-1,6-bisphosphatase/inositol monophosphatase family enzyme